MAFEEATTRAPHRARYWANLAKVRMRQAVQGDIAAAVAAKDAARRAAETDRNEPTAQAALLEVAGVLGDNETAFRAGLAAIRLHSGEAA